MTLRCYPGATWNEADAYYGFSDYITWVKGSVWVLVAQDGGRYKSEPIPSNIEQILDAHIRALDNWEPE